VTSCFVFQLSVSNCFNPILSCDFKVLLFWLQFDSKNTFVSSIHTPLRVCMIWGIKVEHWTNREFVLGYPSTYMEDELEPSKIHKNRIFL
jgi:hypothetical protein